jgi:hypothetical protein
MLSAMKSYGKTFLYCSAVCSATVSSAPLDNAATALVDNLEQKVLSLFNDDLTTLPVTMKRNGITVRVKWDKDDMTAVAESEEIDLLPERFRRFLTEFTEHFPKVNPMSKSILHLTNQDEDPNRLGTKSVLNFPFPLMDRLLIDWRYLKLDRAPNEHLLIISAAGTEQLLEQHWTSQEKKEFVLARTFLCAYWIKPVYDEKNQNVIGSKIKYVYNGDAGGSVPKWIQNTVGPRTAYDSVNGLIKYTKDGHLDT